jgi:hypothetical protein
MPKKVKRGKKRASTEKISINIKNILTTSTARAKRRQAPDIIRPLGKRPIEASAFDNQYRLQNPSVTYASTPLANMASLRDLIQAPSAPQVAGQPPAMRPNTVPVETNPYDLAPKSRVAVAVKPTPLPKPETTPMSDKEATGKQVAILNSFQDNIQISNPLSQLNDPRFNPILGQRVSNAQPINPNDPRFDPRTGAQLFPGEPVSFKQGQTYNMQELPEVDRLRVLDAIRERREIHRQEAINRRRASQVRTPNPPADQP